MFLSKLVHEISKLLIPGMTDRVSYLRYCY